MNIFAVSATALAALLPITNPVGAVAAYAGLSAGMPAADVRRQAIRTGVYVFGILAVFTLLGALVLQALGITLGALQVAGGVVVAHSGFGMLAARKDLRSSEERHAEEKDDISFSPMALPLIAGPGAIGVVIALAARNPGWGDRAGIVVACAVIAALTAVLLRFGTPLVDRLGPTGLGAIMRILGFLILAIGVELIAHGLKAIGLV